jgi:hypothetical protein
VSALDDFETSRAAFHLGYNVGAQVPAGDVARFYEACRRIPDSYWLEQIVNHINRCDRAWAASEVMKNVSETGIIAPSQLQTISGDANRTIQVSDPIKADSYHREVYLRETDRLAESLYVANYRREEVRRYAFERSGSEFINAIPGPADTAVSSRIGLVDGSFGWA